jgi:hypothetical protein
MDVGQRGGGNRIVWGTDVVWANPADVGDTSCGDELHRRDVRTGDHITRGRPTAATTVWAMAGTGGTISDGRAIRPVRLPARGRRGQRNAGRGADRGARLRRSGLCRRGVVLRAIVGVGPAHGGDVHAELLSPWRR